MGISEEKVQSLHDYEGSELFSPLEQLVLRYVEQTSLERRTDDDLEAELRQHFGDTERVELALIVGLWNMTNRLFNTLRVDLEPFVEKHHEELMKRTFAR